MCLHERSPAETIHHDCSKTALSQYVGANRCANECRLHFFLEYFVDVVDLTGINGSFPRNDVKFC